MAARQHGGSTAPAPSEGITVIGQGIHVHGRIHGEEELRIEGRVEGSISLTETVHVAESGVVIATIEARDVVVSGVVVGNVSATNAVHLERGAKLVGDIDAPRLIIADGAAFRGNVAMGEGAGASAAAVARARAAAPSSSRARGSRPASGRAAASASNASRPAPAVARASERERTPAPAARVAAIRPPRPAGVPGEGVTVVVRHAALSEGGGASEGEKETAKKAPPRADLPKPGKRRVNRR